MHRISNWLVKEFPPGAVDWLELAAACERVAEILRQAEYTDTPMGELDPERSPEPSG